MRHRAAGAAAAVTLSVVEINVTLFSRRKVLAAASASILMPRSASAWFPHGSSASSVDTLIVPIMGDSNSGSGQYFNASYDTTRSSLHQIKHDHTFPVAQEPLDLISMSANYVGPTTKLCQFLIDNGHVPAGVVRIIMVPCGWAGTGLSPPGYWNVTGDRYALDGASGIPGVNNGLYGMINAAKAAYPNNKIWFFNLIEGANDGSWAASSWVAAMQAMWSEIRGVYPDSVNAPILVSGIPPDRLNTQLGYVVNLGGIVIAQQAIGSYVSGAYYVDPTTPTVLHSYLGNGFVHYSAASHRGGNYNASNDKATSIASGSYNSGTGVVTLTLSEKINAAPGRSMVISGVTGTGAFTSCNGTFTAGSGTNSTTLNYTIATGLTLTITNSATGSITCTNGCIWYSTVTYTPAGAYIVQNCVVASDNYIYTCIAPTTGDDPTTSPTKWTQQWDTSAIIADTDCLAYRQYQALLSAGF